MLDTPRHIHASSAAAAMMPGTSVTTSSDVMPGSAKGVAAAVRAPKGSGINLGTLSSYKIELLGKDNWLAWKLHMTNMLQVFGVEAHILDPAAKPTDDQMAELAEWKHKDEIAKVLLCGSINDDQVIYLSQDDPAATY